MAVISFKAESTTMTLNGRVVDDFINGDIFEMTPSNPDTSRLYGAGGAVNIQRRSDKDVYSLKFRVMRNSDTDIWLNEQLNADAPTVFDGSIKDRFVKDGEEFTESFTITAGSFTDKPTPKKNNIDGVESMEYTIECLARRKV